MRPHVCPWWLGWMLVSPARRLVDPPGKLLGPHVAPGMTVLDVGCGPGYFSLPLARMVGAAGKVYGVDFQPRMIGALTRRARRAGLADRIVPVACAQDALRLGELGQAFDLVVACCMVHEVPDQRRLFDELAPALGPGGRLLIIEPGYHVSPSDFAESLVVAEAAGYRVATRTEDRWHRIASLARAGADPAAHA
jgi:ubiquinone/menaquinone biosynthesis C-methylase UbiE